MRVFKIMASIVAVVLVCGSLAAFANEAVTITVWDALPESGRPTYLAIVEDFEREHPHIKVEVEFVAGGYQAIREKFVVGLLGDVVPNVVHLAHVHSYSYRYQNLFEPLNDRIAADPDLDLNDFYPPFIETVSLDGNIYGVPYNVSTPLLYFSPERFELSGLDARPPSTWSEMVELGKKIVRDETGDGVPDIWAMDTATSPGWIQEAFLGQAGGRTINEQRTELLLNSREAVETWEFLQGLIHFEGISRYTGAPAADFYGGRLGWSFRSTANLRNYLINAIEAQHPLSVAPMPCHVECYVPIGGGAFYAVDTGSQAERDAAYKFLSFLVRSDNLARYAAGSGYMAGRKSSMESEYLRAVFEDYPEFLVTYEQLAVAHPETQAPEWGRIQALWENRPDFLDPMYRRGEPVKPILDELTRRGNAILNEFYAQNPR